MAKSGAARIFFDIVGQFQSQRLLGDTEAAMTVQKAMMMDVMAGIEEAFMQTSQVILQGVTQTVEAFYEYEQQLVRVRKFYNEMEGDTDTVEVFADAAVRMGEAFAFTGAEALAASARMAQLKGALGEQLAVIEATKQGLMMAQIGEMETEEGMNRFIALAQQTQFLYGGMAEAQYKALTAEQQANVVRESSIHTLNQLNTVENSSVATMEDITFVLNQFASQANIAGESIGEMAAMSALLLESGEEVSRAGTGLRMIYQRLGNANNAATKAIAEHVEGVDAQGVAQMRLTDVLEKLQPAYAEMSAEEKRALAVSVAGSRHYVKFLKLMENHNRLVQLNTAAFNAQFGALDEFNNKMNSTVMQAEILQAQLENMRVAIGKKLADAYATSYKAEMLWLEGINLALERVPVFNEAVGFTIALLNGYEKLAAPMVEIGLNAFNLFVAFKTLNAITGESRAEIQKQAIAFRENERLMRLEQDALESLNGEYLKFSFQVNNAQKQAKREATEQVKRLEGRHKEIGALQTYTNQATKAAALELELFQQRTKGRQRWSKTQYQANDMMKKGLILQEKLKVQSGKNLAAINAARAANEMEARVSARVSASKSERLMMEQRSLKEKAQALMQQDRMNAALSEEARILSQSVILHQPLEAATLRRLKTRGAELNFSQRELVARMAALNSERAELLSKEQSTKAIDRKIAAVQRQINAEAAERQQIQGLIIANNQLTGAIAQRDMKERSALATIGTTTKAFFTQSTALKAVRAGLMGVTMLVPMFIDQENQMEAMVAMTAFTLVGSMIPALTATGVKLTELITLQAMVTGGLSLLVAGIAGFAAYKGMDYLIDDVGLLNGLIADGYTEIENFNGELDRTAQLLSDLKGPAGGTEVFASLFGTTTFDDLKQDMDLAISTQDALADAIAKQQTIYEQGDLSATERASVGLYLGQLDAAYQKVEAIADAHRIVNQEVVDGTQSMYQILDRELTGPSFMDVVLARGDASLAEFAKSQMSFKDIVLQYYDETGELQEEYFSNENKAQERANELKLDGFDVAAEYARDYYAALLEVQGVTNDEMIKSDIQLYNHLLNAQNEFANAREELFFGQRSNFTGQLYKQVVQGGVESLLHHVEIVQTNNFHGYNTDEMVDAVTSRVLSEVRRQTSGAI